MHVHIGLQLVLLVALTVGLGLHLWGNLGTMPKRRFVALCTLFGFLVVLTIGGLYETPIAASLLKLKHSGSLAEGNLYRIKTAVALGAVALSIYEGLRIKAKSPIPRHIVQGVAAILVLLAVGSYYRFGDLGYSNFYHRWEFYHYYLGSKYNRELGYERLYACTAVAQADLGMTSEVRSRKLRDLKIDLLEPAQEALDHGDDCRNRFTKERWEAYKADVKWFRNSSNIQYWNDMQKDHGYNPPPVWTVLGNLLASLQPASDGFFKALASIDLALFAGTFGALYWAFGWRVFSVAAIFWGCQLPAEYFWTGGAFLRQDWLFLLVLSISLLKKRYYALGGAAFAYSTLLRVFPGALIAGWAVQIALHLWKHKRMDPRHTRLILGGVGASVLLVSISIAVAGASAYPEFYRHIQVHNHTALTNNMGLPTLLQHSWEGRMKFARDEKLLDPFGPWKDLRAKRLEAFRPLQVLILACIAAGFVYAMRKIRSLWVAQALSLVVFISVVEVTCYYYTIFILAAVLARMRRGVEQGILLVAGASELLAINRWFSHFYDDRYVAQSVLFVGLALGLLVAHFPRRPAGAKVSALPLDSDKSTPADATGSADKSAPQAS